jgi:hypothetical protein
MQQGTGAAVDGAGGRRNATSAEDSPTRRPRLNIGIGQQVPGLGLGRQCHQQQRQCEGKADKANSENLFCVHVFSPYFDDVVDCRNRFFKKWLRENCSGLQSPFVEYFLCAKDHTCLCQFPLSFTLSIT